MSFKTWQGHFWEVGKSKVPDSSQSRGFNNIVSCTPKNTIIGGLSLQAKLSSIAGIYSPGTSTRLNCRHIEAVATPLCHCNSWFLFFLFQETLTRLGYTPFRTLQPCCKERAQPKLSIMWMGRIIDEDIMAEKETLIYIWNFYVYF